MIWITRRTLLSVLLLSILAACGNTTETASTATPAARGGNAPAGSDVSIQAILAASTIVVGANRLPIGIVVDGTPINDPNALVSMRFYYLDGPEPTTVVGETGTTYFGRNLPFGVYVAYPNMPKAGAWGLEVAMTVPGKPTAVSRLRLDVLANDPTPALESPAIVVDTPTAQTLAELEQITSDSQPNLALYQLSVREALKQRKPLAILFGTPGFCKTAVCGPSIQVMGNLQRTYGDRMNFVHVEVYQYPFAESVQANPPRFSAGMTAWGLQSEPWVFLIDATGLIRYKYEGGITDDELTLVLDELLKQPGGQDK